jgi:two-component system NtrC family sensor kinase
MNKLPHKKIILLIIGLSFSLLLSSQPNQRIDSLLTLDLKKYPDSIKLELYNTISGLTDDPQIKIKYAKLLLAKSIGFDLKWELRGYLNLGNANKISGNFDLALNHYFKALEIAQNMTSTQQIMINLTIADTYKEVGNFTNANKYYLEGKQAFIDSKIPKRIDSIYLVGIYTNLGDMFLIQEKYDSALQNFQQAKHLAELINYDIYLAVIRGNIAIVYAALGQDESAEEEIEKSIDYLGKRGEWNTVAEFLIYLSDIYKDKEQFDKALEYAQKTNELAIQYGLKKRIQEASFRLYELMQIKGDYKSALAYHEDYVLYKDSVLNLETVQKMADQRTQFEVGQKQTEVNLLTSEKRIQKIIIFSTAGGALLVAILLGLVYKNYLDKNKINKILEVQKTQLEDLNRTKDRFFSIISHDIRGPVHAFSGISSLIKYAVEEKNHEELIDIAKHVDKTSNDLTELLDGLLSWALQQQGHFPHVPEKLNLEKMGQEINGIFSNSAKAKKIEITTSIPDNLELWVDKNTSMTILRNLVNNALKFTSEGGQVSILAEAESATMAKITIKDTGVGIPPEKLNALFKMDGYKASYGTGGERGLGLGLQLVYEFVEMNNGTVEVESEEGKGTSFIVHLPLYDYANDKAEA